MKNSFAMAAKAIIFRDGKFLVLHRSKKEMESSKLNKKEVWDLPGGGVKFFETVHNALTREIWEETGIKTETKDIFSCYDIIKNGIHLSIITYLCIYRSGEVSLSAEHDAFYWLAVEEMEEMNIPKWMIRDFKKALEVCTKA